MPSARFEEFVRSPRVVFMTPKDVRVRVRQDGIANKQTGISVQGTTGSRKLHYPTSARGKDAPYASAEEPSEPK